MKQVSDWPILMTGWSMQRILRRVKTQTRRMNRDFLKRKAGDVLWCRESLRRPDGGPWEYASDSAPVIVSPDDETAMLVWAHHRDLDRCPPIYMPRFACRQRIRLTADPYLQPVQHISAADAVAEGCDSCTPYDEYRAIWEQINNKNAEHRWAANPEVVVLKFEVL